MPLKPKDKQLLYQPYWTQTHFELIQSYQDALAVELHYLTGKKSAVVVFQWDHITQIGKDRIKIIVPDTTKQEIAYIISYNDITQHRYTEKDKDNLNQETKKEE